MSARRWPIVTLGLIAINIIVFLFTQFSTDDQQEQQTRTIRAHLIMLAATHPELTVPESVQKMLDTVDALKFYEAAAASPVPHLDWEQTIAAAIRDAKKAMETTSLAPS
jgi:membrane associated rhomboid family serine protease